MTASPSVIAALDARYRIAVILTIAFVASAVLYVVVAEILRQVVAWKAVLPAEHHDVVRAAVAGLAIVDVALIGLVRGRMLSAPVPAGTADARLQRLHVAAVATGAMAEVPALLGFFLFLLTASAVDSMAWSRCRCWPR